MNKNEHSTDRILRIVISLIIAFFIFSGSISGTAAIIAGIFAFIFLFTALTGFCPLYALIGISTAKKPS